jgi:ribosomal protein L11 methyltransferase
MEIRFKPESIPGFIAEVLPVYLSPLGFDSFTETEEGLNAYIPEDLYDRQALEACLHENGFDQASFSETLITGRNWNVEWEKNYEPVVIDNTCLIRAPFHSPDTNFPLELVIEPKMSFGTGHHETTSLMVSEMLRIPFGGKQVLDAGCGTGILAILAEKLGAVAITAVDIDPWCIENAIENADRNSCRNITVLQADTTVLPHVQFDCILANINLNILLESIPIYAGRLRTNGILLMSGILASDTEVLQARAKQEGFEFSGTRVQQNWALVRYIKTG